MLHKMKSMKLSESEMKGKEPTALADVPKYPYGLSIHLDEESIKKLGMASLPAVGEKMTAAALVEVTSISMSDNLNGGKNRSISLQITDLGLYEPEKPDAKDPTEVLYKKEA